VCVLAGEGGYQLRADIEEKIEKWQEPPKGPEKKPLPVPDEGYKKKRGGKRWVGGGGMLHAWAWMGSSCCCPRLLVLLSV
jgi:hypothetical protein